MKITFKDWEKQRAKLHHDWLQNKFITFLKANLGCLNNPSTCVDDFDDVLGQLLEWERKRPAFVLFVDRTEEALSPRQLLEEYPLVKLSPEDKIWLGDLIHALYLHRTKVHDMVQVLKELHSKIDDLVALTVDHLKGEPKISHDRFGDKLLKEVLVFSAIISKLPHSVQII